LASKNEEEFRRLNLELRLLEQTAETLQSRMNMINAAATDLRYAQTTLEGLEKENEKSELLVPVGGTSYIRARLDNPNQVIVGMGAGVSVEKTREEAKEIIKKRLADLEKARTSVQQQFAQVAEKINQDREKAEALVATAREGKTQQDV
jgi:prefoldin alpha subunit